jgi:hypothetical protein
MRNSENEIYPCLISIDKEGQWFHKGVPMVRREFVRSFYEKMTLDDSGRYIIDWDGKPCHVEVEDTAFVVRSVSFKNNGSDDIVQLELTDDSREELLPDTLYQSLSNVIYCRVKEGRFPARFNRAAYYQLAAAVETDGKTYFLPLNGKKYMIFQQATT